MFISEKLQGEWACGKTTLVIGPDSITINGPHAPTTLNNIIAVFHTENTENNGTLFQYNKNENVFNPIYDYEITSGLLTLTIKGMSTTFVKVNKGAVKVNKGAVVKQRLFGKWFHVKYNTEITIENYEIRYPLLTYKITGIDEASINLWHVVYGLVVLKYSFVGDNLILEFNSHQEEYKKEATEQIKHVETTEQYKQAKQNKLPLSCKQVKDFRDKLDTALSSLKWEDIAIVRDVLNCILKGESPLQGLSENIDARGVWVNDNVLEITNKHFIENDLCYELSVSGRRFKICSGGVTKFGQMFIADGKLLLKYDNNEREIVWTRGSCIDTMRGVWQSMNNDRLVVLSSKVFLYNDTVLHVNSDFVAGNGELAFKIARTVDRFLDVCNVKERTSVQFSKVRRLQLHEGVFLAEPKNSVADQIVCFENSVWFDGQRQNNWHSFKKNDKDYKVDNIRDWLCLTTENELLSYRRDT